MAPAAVLVLLPFCFWRRPEPTQTTMSLLTALDVVELEIKPFCFWVSRCGTAALLLGAGGVLVLFVALVALASLAALPALTVLLALMVFLALVVLLALVALITMDRFDALSSRTEILVVVVAGRS